MENIGNIIEKYSTLKGQKQALDAEYKEKLEAIDEQLTILENKLFERMESDGCRSYATPIGTVFTRETKKYTVGDFGAFSDWILNERKDLGFLQKRISATEVARFEEEEGKLPPGCMKSVETGLVFKKK